MKFKDALASLGFTSVIHWITGWMSPKLGHSLGHFFGVRLGYSRQPWACSHYNSIWPKHNWQTFNSLSSPYFKTKGFRSLQQNFFLLLFWRRWRGFGQVLPSWLIRLLSFRQCDPQDVQEVNSIRFESVVRKGWSYISHFQLQQTQLNGNNKLW